MPCLVDPVLRQVKNPDRQSRSTSKKEAWKESMSTRTVISCDVEGCGRDQGANNHWFAVWVEKGVYCVCSVAKAPKNKKGLKHACSADHETRFHDRWLSTGNLLMQMHPEPKTRPVGLKAENLGCPTGIAESMMVEQIDDLPPWPK